MWACFKCHTATRYSELEVVIPEVSSSCVELCPAEERATARWSTFRTSRTWYVLCSQCSRVAQTALCSESSLLRNEPSITVRNSHSNLAGAQCCVSNLFQSQFQERNQAATCFVALISKQIGCRATNYSTGLNCDKQLAMPVWNHTPHNKIWEPCLQLDDKPIPNIVAYRSWRKCTEASLAVSRIYSKSRSNQLH